MMTTKHHRHPHLYSLLLGDCCGTPHLPQPSASVKLNDHKPTKSLMIDFCRIINPHPKTAFLDLLRNRFIASLCIDSK